MFDIVFISVINLQEECIRHCYMHTFNSRQCQDITVSQCQSWWFKILKT